MPTPSRRPEGIAFRHQLRCAAHAGATCDCRPTYQAQAFSARERKTIRKTFRNISDARAWRAEAQTALRQGTLSAPTKTTLAEAATVWLEAAERGVVRTRSGDPYKPSARRGYEQALRTKLLPELGHQRLSAITRNMVQDLADRLVADGLSASTVRNAVLPLRAIYRRALARSEVLTNPTLGLALPAYRGGRERVACPAEGNALLEALPEGDRAVWATALYAGLRRGELRALRWCDVDLEGGVVRVERSWDDRVGVIAPKSRAGRRRVPLAGPLRPYLAAQRLFPVSGAGTGLRPRRGRSARHRVARRPGSPGLAASRARADRSSRVPPYLRRLHDRRGRQRKGALLLHGALDDHDDPRPLRPPHARQRGRSGRDARRLPGA